MSLKSKLLAVFLAAVTALSAAVPGSAYAAGPAEEETSSAVETEAVSGQTRQEEETGNAAGGAASQEELSTEASLEEEPETVTGGKKEIEAGTAAEDPENSTAQAAAPDTDPVAEEAPAGATSGSAGTETAAEEEPGTGVTSASYIETEIAAEEEPASGVSPQAEPENSEKGVTVPGAEKKADDILTKMPAFSAELKAGQYTVRISAEAGVFPEGTKAQVRELSGAEAEPYARKAEEMAGSGLTTAVIDICFTDQNGAEIQPLGMVGVVFDNAVSEDAEMSVYHACGGSANRMEAVSSSIRGDSVEISSKSFSPYVLLAASSEPNWTKGGKGDSKDVSDEISIVLRNGDNYHYKEREYGNWVTLSYDMYISSENLGRGVCLDPLLNGYHLEGVKSGAVYEISAPMLVKALYYGVGGPGSSVVEKAAGTSETGAVNIVTHVAASEIYSRLGYAENSSPGDGFKNASNKLREHVYKFVSALEDLPVPDNYYVYVAADNDFGDGGVNQNFGFGSYSLTHKHGYGKVIKTSSEPSITDGNSCYSYRAAVYRAYNTEAEAKKRSDKEIANTFATYENGVSNAKKLKPGKYYMIEIRAPKGYKLSDKIYAFTVKDNETTEVKVNDPPVNDPGSIVIDKKCKGSSGTNINSLEGTQFTVCYYDGYYGSSSLPSKPVRSWVIEAKKTSGGLYRASLDKAHLVSGDAFYTAGGQITLPLGTVTIRETKAAAGYKNDGTFGGAAMYIGQIGVGDDGDGKLIDIQGKRGTSNTFEIADSPETPQVGTSAVNSAAGERFACAGEKVTIEDTVSYKNLVAGSEYVVKGRLVDKETGKAVMDADGREVTAQRSFKAGSMSGTVTVSFTFKSDSSMAGRSAVVFETVSQGDKVVAAHENLGDGAQTILFPEIGTEAVNPDTGDNIICAGENAQITDKVTYRNLIPNKEYTLRGVLMEKSGKVLTAGGKEVTAEKTFTPQQADGETDLTFRFNAEGLNDSEAVVFEELYCKGTLAAYHKDIDDRAQTVYLPGVITDACDRDTGKKNTLAAEDRVIVDRVSYSNLLAGKTYEISGEVKIIEDGVLFDDAQTVPSQIIGAEGKGSITFDQEKVTFVPEGAKGEPVSGEILISFKVDASELAGEDLVVGETVRTGNVDLAVHRDLSDEKQTFYIPKGQTYAVDAATGIKNTLAADHRVFIDSFRYENLLPGETYRFTGKLMAETGRDENGAVILEEIPSVMTDEAGEPVPDGYVEFVPESEDGAVELYFAADASELAGRNVTVFEKVSLGGEPVIIHEEMDGTQTVYVPEGKTAVFDTETMDRISNPDGEVSIIDTLEYRNLIPGEEYTVRGRIIKKSSAEEVPSTLAGAAFKEKDPEESGEEALDNLGEEASDNLGEEDSAQPGGAVSVEDNTVTFTPESADGALQLTFEFDGSALAGEDTVVFERVYHGGKEVIVHENIDDEYQTIHFPSGATKAGDPDTGGRTMKAGGEVTIRDRFLYENLIPGAEYVIRGKVMLKPSAGEEAQELEAKMTDPDGNEVEEWRFTPENKDGYEELFFVINTDGLAGSSAVVFETMEFVSAELETRIPVITHEDIGDEDQTIRFPDGKTTALYSETGSHTANAAEEVTILDEVKYRNLIPGETYTVTGTLMDKETNTPVTSEGSAVTASKEFVPVSSDGSIIVEFTFSGVDLAGRSAVAFETVTSGGKEVFVHADLYDEEQTINFPEVRTEAVDKKDGDHEIAHEGTVSVIDEVQYKNLTPGAKYRVSGILMDKASGKPAKAGGKEITGETEFRAVKADGSVKVTLSFDSSALKDGEYVVFEPLYEINEETGDETEVGSHRDLKDASQTVKRRTPPGDRTQTGDNSNALFWIAMAAAAAAVIAVAAALRKSIRAEEK